MSDVTIKLTLPVNCPHCGHAFKIDPVGVQPWTEIVCPSCGAIDHVSQETIDRVEDELIEAISAIYDEEDDYQIAIAFWYEAPAKSRATIINEGF